VPYFCCLLAEALADEGNFTEAFHFIEKAEAEIASKGERWLESEHYRIKGEIILKRNPTDKSAAQASFEQAIQVARQQKAIFFEQKAQACLNQMSSPQA
jgi:predicted ATPase